jgi:hypothetical protein
LEVESSSEIFTKLLIIIAYIKNYDKLRQFYPKNDCEMFAKSIFTTCTVFLTIYSSADIMKLLALDLLPKYEKRNKVSRSVSRPDIIP